MARKRTPRKKKTASTRAGKYVRDEMHSIRKNSKRGPRTKKQAIAIGLSKAREAGIRVPKKKRKAA